MPGTILSSSHLIFFLKYLFNLFYAVKVQKKWDFCLLHNNLSTVKSRRASLPATTGMRTCSGRNSSRKASTCLTLVDDFGDAPRGVIEAVFCYRPLKFCRKNAERQEEQEKYKGLIPSYVRNSSIVFIVYDVSNRSSFDNVQNWITFVKNIEKIVKMR